MVFDVCLSFAVYIKELTLFHFRPHPPQIQTHSDGFVCGLLSKYFN